MRRTETLSAQNADSEATGPAPETGTPHKHVKTVGEKKFDWEVYGRIGYYANVAISLAAVLVAERTKWGQNRVRDLGKLLAKTGLKNGEWWARKSLFLAGGFAVIPPMKWLENKKVETIKKENREIYGDKADSDPTIQQSEKELEAAPKQTWKSVLSGRALALVPFYLGYWLIWDHDSPLAKRTQGIMKGGLHVDQLLSRASRGMGWLISHVTPGGKAARGAIEELHKAAPGIMESVAKAGELHDPLHSAGPYYFFSEIITSAIVAAGVYAMTRITGPFFGQHQPQVEAAKPAAAALAKKQEQASQDDATPKKMDTPSLTVMDASLASRLQQPDMAMAAAK